MMPMGIQNPANPDASEILQLMAFANQDDNLGKLGWDLNDCSTWEGILWTDDTENRVQSIDITYKEKHGKDFDWAW